jgi:hypothetical protein
MKARRKAKTLSIIRKKRFEQNIHEDFCEVCGKKEIEELIECVRNFKRGSQLRTNYVSFCRRRTAGANGIL